MDDIFSNRQNVLKIIENCHKNSFYSSFPVPNLIAVSKQQPENKIQDAIKAGHRIFGENKIQDGILADIAPTILDILGVDKPAEMTGRSLISS